jgi:hypothetical protein
MVLTNCTNRKRHPPSEALLARSLRRGNLAATTREWVSRLRTAQDQFVAKQLYCGRAMTETLRTVDALHAQTAFVSAGLGVVPQNQKVPSYSLTASSGHLDSVSGRIVGHYDPARWWQSLARAQGSERPLAEFIECHHPRLVLVAMPASYVAMVVHELAELAPKVRTRVRLIGPRRLEDLPEYLHSLWLPYDARLDNPKTGINGTASDFPHRALRHFALHILPQNPRGTSTAHAAAVETAMSRFKAYVRPRGRNTTDENLIRMIKKMWVRHGGRRTPMLRDLRDNARLACEQRRFQRLAHQYEKSLRASK